MPSNPQAALKEKREFSYITPQGRRPTEYEELTLHIQQDPKNFAWAGWTLRSPEGRPAWTDSSTALRSSDWWAFRDPGKTWQRPYVKLQAEQGKALERIVQTAKNRGLFSHFEPIWANDVLAKHYASCAFIEYGLFRCFSYAQREALSDIIGNACVFNAADKIRYAQEISLYGMELGDALSDFSDAEAKHIWTTDPMWQAARENVEKLMVLPDWGEIIVGINLVLEPLLGELLRSEFFVRFAPRNGDSVTPAIIESAELDWERTQKWTAAFVQMLVHDPEQGKHNKHTIETWIEKWRPLTVRAVEKVAPLFDLPPVKPQTFTAAYTHIQQTHTRWLAELELSAPV